MLNTKHNNIIKFFKNKEHHPFHLVEKSLLPLVTAFSVLLIALSLTLYWHPTEITFVKQYDQILIQVAVAMLMLVMFSWFISVVDESSAGHHTRVVGSGFKLGMILFIVSEFMLFVAFFWAYFHFSLSPSIAIGCVWPPEGITPVDLWGLPLINTILLLTSGITITLAHRAVLKSSTYEKKVEFKNYLALTIALGLAFLFCQGFEYEHGITFTWKYNVYGSSFYILTAFHGFHVMVGTVFLLFCWIRASLSTFKPWTFIDKGSNGIFKETIVGFMILLSNKKLNRIKGFALLKRFQDYITSLGFTQNQHLGFEFSSWYWHFVDVIWLFLFITLYWWGA